MLRSFGHGWLDLSLKEDRRQSILTVFNWARSERDHSIDIASLGLPAADSYRVSDVLRREDEPSLENGVLKLHLPAHSVRVLKILDTRYSPSVPELSVEHPTEGKAGATLQFSARCGEIDPVILYQWNFGDGVSVGGKEARHTYTEPGDYDVHLVANGLDVVTAEEHYKIHVSGRMAATFDPSRNQRYEPAQW